MDVTSSAGVSVSAATGRRVIASGCSCDGWKDIASLTWPAMEEYGKTFGIPFASYTAKGPLLRPESWRKLIYIADCFAGADEVLWLDADVAIVDQTRNIFDEFPAGASQAMAFLDGSPPHWNCGVWLIRKQMLPVLMEVAMQDHCVNHHWWEQKAVNELTERLKIPTHRLGEEWNHWTGSPRGISPRFRHACGSGEKASLLRNWLG